MMIRFKLTEPPPRYPFDGFVPAEMFVILRTNSVHESVPVEFEGSPYLITVLTSQLLFSAHADRRNGVPYLSPMRLHEGLQQPQMEPYQAELVEGHAILGVT